MVAKSEAQAYQLYRKTLKGMSKTANRGISVGKGSSTMNKQIQSVCDQLLSDVKVPTHDTCNNGAANREKIEI